MIDTIDNLRGKASFTPEEIKEIWDLIDLKQQAPTESKRQFEIKFELRDFMLKIGA